MHKKNDVYDKDTPLYGVVDERTKFVVYQGDAYAGRFVMFAVLLDVFIRGLEPGIPFINSNLDLILIIITGGIISTVYQIKNKVLFNRPFSRSFLFLIVILGISALIAFALAFFSAK